MLGLSNGLRLRPSTGWFARAGRSTGPSRDVTNINNDSPPNFVVTRRPFLAASSHLRRPFLTGSVYRSLSDYYERTSPSSFVAHSPYWPCAQEDAPSSAVPFSSQPEPCTYTFDAGSSSEAGLLLPLGLPREQITPSGATSY